MLPKLLITALLALPAPRPLSPRTRTPPAASSSKTAPTSSSPNMKSKATASATTAPSAKSGRSSPTRSSIGPPPRNSKRIAPPAPPLLKPSNSTRKSKKKTNARKPNCRKSPRTSLPERFRRLYARQFSGRASDRRDPADRRRHQPQHQGQHLPRQPSIPSPDSSRPSNSTALTPPSRLTSSVPSLYINVDDAPGQPAQPSTHADPS